jgi:inosine-uridine nucleoside N-ribohydrolase
VFRETAFAIVLFPLDITNAAAITPSFMDTLLTQGKVHPKSFLAHQSYSIVAAESFYDMWDVTAAVWLARPKLYEPASTMRLSVVTADEGMQGAVAPADDGRSIEVFLGFADLAGFYNYVAGQFAS